MFWMQIKVKEANDVVDKISLKEGDIRKLNQDDINKRQKDRVLVSIKCDLYEKIEKYL